MQFSSIDTVGEFADIRASDSRAADALGAADSALQVLIMPRRHLARALLHRPCGDSRIGALQPSNPAPRRPTIRAGVELIYVNVVVRDGSGNIVRNLKREDFSLVEDDKTQVITAFDFEEVPSDPAPAAEPLPPVQPVLKAESGQAGAAADKAPAATAKVDSIDFKNRRLIVLLLDSSSMQPEELERAAVSAHEYVEKRLTPADLVAVASIGSSLQIVQDFTSDRETLAAAIDKVSGVDSLGFGEGSTLTGKRPTPTASSPTTASSTSSTQTGASPRSSSCLTRWRRSSRRSRSSTSAAA